MFHYWPRCVTPSCISVTLPLFTRLRNPFYKGHRYFPVPWFWTQPCDWLWPTRWGRDANVPVPSLEQSRLGISACLLGLPPAPERTRPGSKEDMMYHGAESTLGPQWESRVPRWAWKKWAKSHVTCRLCQGQHYHCFKATNFWEGLLGDHSQLIWGVYQSKSKLPLHFKPTHHRQRNRLHRKPYLCLWNNLLVEVIYISLYI